MRSAEQFAVERGIMQRPEKETIADHPTAPADIPETMNASSNPYCEALGIAVPRFEVAAKSRDAAGASRHRADD